MALLLTITYNFLGLIIIVNPFTNLGQRYWIARSVADYSDSPSVTNLQNHNDLCLLLNNKPWWDSASWYVSILNKIKN